MNDDITLENVFGIPQFSINLISVSQICGHTNYQFQLAKDTCFLQEVLVDEIEKMEEGKAN